MFYCPKCKYKLYIELDLQNISADFSTNILTNSLSLAICSLGNFLHLDVKGFRCMSCNKLFALEEINIRSQISEITDEVENFIIVSVKSKSENMINGKIQLVIPPKIIHKTELEKFKKYNNPYGDEYLIINPIADISIKLPQ